MRRRKRESECQKIVFKSISKTFLQRFSRQEIFMESPSTSDLHQLKTVSNHELDKKCLLTSGKKERIATNRNTTPHMETKFNVRNSSSVAVLLLLLFYACQVNKLLKK